MKYKFPIIESFDDIEHAIDRDLFVVAERDGHVIVNYNFMSPEVFPEITDDCDIAQIRREFRGLIFDEAGKLIRRPFHKFFNVNEREDTRIQNIDVSKQHTIYDKLDGSMIAPYEVGIDIIWGTKMGDTDVAQQVHKFVEDRTNYQNFARDMIAEGYTPIFEWMSRQQRIVLDYGQSDSLVLTAIRDMRTGEYVSRTRKEIAEKVYSIPVCSHVLDSFSEDFVNKAKDVQDLEGFVIRFNDGHMLKIKSEWYVALHRVKSQIENERGVVALILNNDIDDLKPLLTAEDLRDIEKYEEALAFRFMHVIDKIDMLMRATYKKGYSRKEFALEVADKLQSYEKHILFKLWDERGMNNDRYKIKDLVTKTVLSHCTRNSKFNEFRTTTELFEPIKPWKGVKLDD